MIPLTMKRFCSLMLLTLGFMGCNSTYKPEATYESILGEWYLYAAYLNGSDTDVLPTVKVFYPCIEGSLAEFNMDSSFRMISDCEGGTVFGFYSFRHDTIFATDTSGYTQILVFRDGSLFQEREIPVLGVANLRFQKTNE